jgi:hypothetical protein
MIDDSKMTDYTPIEPALKKGARRAKTIPTIPETADINNIPLGLDSTLLYASILLLYALGTISAFTLVFRSPIAQFFVLCLFALDRFVRFGYPDRQRCARCTRRTKAIARCYRSRAKSAELRGRLRRLPNIVPEELEECRRPRTENRLISADKGQKEDEESPTPTRERRQEPEAPYPSGTEEQSNEPRSTNKRRSTSSWKEWPIDPPKTPDSSSQKPLIDPSPRIAMTPTAPVFYGIMPRPGQPGAMHPFDGMNSTEYLEEWNTQSDDYRYDDKQRATRFPNFCTANVKDIVKLLSGYIKKDWKGLQADIKNLYLQYDEPKDSMAALNELVRKGRTLDLNVYILKYHAISEALVSKNALSTLDRVSRLLDGLSDDLRREVLNLCSQKSWRIAPHDSGTTPDYKAIKEFLSTEASTIQKLAIYNNDCAMREPATLESTERTSVEAMPIVLTPTAPTAPTATTATTAPTAPALDPIVDLSKQFSHMALMLQAALNSSRDIMTSPMASTKPRMSERIPRCIFCDSTEHTRRSQCPDFADALRRKRVYLNERNHVVNAATHKEIRPMFGNGGMKNALERFMRTRGQEDKRTRGQEVKNPGERQEDENSRGREDENNENNENPRGREPENPRIQEGGARGQCKRVRIRES